MGAADDRGAGAAEGVVDDLPVSGYGGGVVPVGVDAVVVVDDSGPLVGGDPRRRRDVACRAAELDGVADPGSPCGVPVFEGRALRGVVVREGFELDVGRDVLRERVGAPGVGEGEVFGEGRGPLGGARLRRRVRRVSARANTFSPSPLLPFSKGCIYLRAQ